MKKQKKLKWIPSNCEWLAETCDVSNPDYVLYYEITVNKDGQFILIDTDAPLLKKADLKQKFSDLVSAKEFCQKKDNERYATQHV